MLEAPLHATVTGFWKAGGCDISLSKRLLPGCPAGMEFSLSQKETVISLVDPPMSGRSGKEVVLSAVPSQRALVATLGQ